MKGITKEVIEQDFKVIQNMFYRYKEAIYENQEGQPAHFDNQSKLCRLRKNSQESPRTSVVGVCQLLVTSVAVCLLPVMP